MLSIQDAVSFSVLSASLIATAFAVWRIATRQPVFEPSSAPRQPVSDFAFAAACLLLGFSLVGRFSGDGGMLREIDAPLLLNGLIYEVLCYGLLFLIWHYSNDFRRRPRTLEELQNPPPESASTAPLLAAPHDIRFEMMQGALAFLLCLPWVLLVNLGMRELTQVEELHPLLETVRNNESPTILLLVAAQAVVMAPLLEELQFRVILQGWFAGRIPWHVELLIPAAFFCMAHGWPDSVALIPLALTLGRLYQRRGSYIGIVTAHMLFNLLNLALLVSET